MSKLQTSPDIIGKIFHRLTITQNLGVIGKTRFVKALCECGKEKTYRLQHLKSSAIKSCGCLKLENLDGTRTTHGLTKHPLYSVYCGIKRRCYNKNDKFYKDYGGRGIVMCDEWKNDFKTFYNWAITHGYEKGLIIDRERVNDIYQPDNCRFVSTIDSARNTRASVFLEFNGERKTMAEWGEIKGLSNQKIWQRIRRDKWSVERALSTL